MDVLQSQVPGSTPPPNIGSSFPTYQATPISEPLTESLKPKKSHKLLIILLVLLVVLVGGGVWAYPMVSSSAVISSLEKLDTSTKASGKLTIRLITDDPRLATSSASVYGEIDRSEPTGWPTRLVIDVDSPYYTGDSELRIIEQVLYGKSDVLNADFLRAAGFPASLWYSMKIETLKLVTQSSGSTSYGLDSILSSKRPQVSLAERYKKIQDAGVISKPTFKSIGKVDGTYVRTYQFVIDKDKLAEYLVTIFAQRFPEQTSRSEEARAIAKEQIKNIDITPITASVSLFGSDIREVTLGVSASDEIKDKTRGVTGVDFVFEHDPDNSAFVITVPEGAVSLDTLALQMIEDAKLKAEQARVRASLGSMRSVLEIYYDRGQTYVGGCTGSQVSTMSADIKSLGFTFTCRSSAKAYLIAATGFDPGTRATTSICFDSTGQYKTLSKLSSGYLCK